MPHEKPPSAGATPLPTAAVLLAAGAGSRFADVGHKLLARLTELGPTIFETSLRHALDANIGSLIVVTGALDETALRSDSGLARLLDHPAVHVRHNSAWADGQAGSLHLGLSTAAELGHDAAVIGLADQPFVPAQSWIQVAGGLGPITVATYDGRRGNPVKLHASMWELLPASGDEGARVLMRARPDLVVEVPCTGSPADIDTVEDLHQWQNN
jgi:molybdenum cofactor cytidylyltransferase